MRIEEFPQFHKLNNIPITHPLLLIRKTPANGCFPF